MTSADRQCDGTDVVLARFLDGDPDHDRVATAHFEACAACRSALRRARRLDALLAQHSTVEVPAALADRLLTAALPTKPLERRRRLPLALGAAALVLAGVALGMWLRGSPAVPDRVPTTSVQVPPADAGPGKVFDLLPLPAARRLPPRGRGAFRAPARAPLADAVVLVHEDLDRALLPTVAFVRGLHHFVLPESGTALRWAELERAAASLAHAARIEAGTRLMRSRRTADHRQFVAFLATAPASDVRRELLAAARDDAATVRRMHAALGRSRPDEEVLVAAARLGHPRLDAALLRVVRRWPGTADAIVEAMVRVPERPRRVDAMLDVWQALRDRRALVPRETRMFEAAFRRLPAAVTGELVATSEAAKRPERRLQCVTALGWRADPASIGSLLGLVDSRHHETALAAGHALSRMPRDAEEAVAAGLPHSRRAHVLLAALCGMQSELPRTRLRTAELTEEESAFLRSGSFTTRQFAIACALCRRRSVLSD